MYKQETKKLSSSLEPVSTKLATEKETPTSNNKTSLAKRKKSEANLDSSIMNDKRKKMQKVTHSNMIDEESVEKMKSEIMLDPSFVQTKIACACGLGHTLTLSEDGTVHSFGKNEFSEQLGLALYHNVSLPTPIPNLPKIKLIACGANFSVCVDYEGFIWSFGENNCGQLGTGTVKSLYVHNVPQKVQNIPPVLSVACGSEHTLIITNDSNLWSCGKNEFGQLCLGDTERGCSIPQKTSFSTISKISAGHSHSLFQNHNGEIFACGYNEHGQCGLGHYNSPQLTPSLIPNAPSNIIEVICGYLQSLFLDSEGNVFSSGDNWYGSLGLGHNRNQNELNKIPNIPPIKIISCVKSSCYLIDFEGNLWSFGCNGDGQLGHGDKTHQNTPKIINTLKDIQQISYGSNGHHFLAKNSQNQIFATGNNSSGQLGTGDNQSFPIPKEIDSQYSTIWRDDIFHSKAKSARK